MDAKGPDEAKVKDNRIWTLWRNAYRLRCPVCKQGKIFSGWFRVKQRCPVCRILIEREQGYFLGSIYFNYGMTSVLVILLFLFLRFGLAWPDAAVLGILTPFTVLFPIFFFQYARSSWLVFDQYFQPREPSNEDDGDARRNETHFP